MPRSHRRPDVSPWADAGSARRTYPERVTWLLRRRDPLLAAAFLVYGMAELVAGGDYEGRPEWPGAWPLPLVGLVLMTVPLAWRRSRPTASCAVVFATVAAYSLAVGAVEATSLFLAVLVACFSGTAYARRPWLVVGMAAAAMAAHDAVDPAVHGPGDWFWSAGFVAVALLLGAAVRTRQIRIFSLERDAERREREQQERVAQATAAERAAIARELHDIVAHAVSVIVVQAQAGVRSVRDDPDTTERLLETIETTGRSALDDLRRLLRLLSVEGQPVDPSPGLAHLADLVDRFRGAGLAVELELPDPLPRLSTAADLAAYRLVQEALTNTVRHAPGAPAGVVVACNGAEVEVSVTDAGSSSPPRDDLGAGRGLIGMRERVGLAGGRLLECGPTGQGFRVRAVLPQADEVAYA
jgi:signal transduction histidine kinase